MCGGIVCHVDWTLAGDSGCLNWWSKQVQSWFQQVPLHNFRCFVTTAKTTSEFIASMAIMTCVTIMHTRHMCQAKTEVIYLFIFGYCYYLSNHSIFKSLIVQVFGWRIQIHTTEVTLLHCACVVDS